MCTLIWLFTCVSTEGCGQIHLGVKRLVTLCTLISLFTCVSTEMRGQTPQLVKRLVRLCSLVWPFTCVSSELLGQMTQLVITSCYIVYTDMAFHLCEYGGAWSDYSVG